MYPYQNHFQQTFQPGYMPQATYGQMVQPVQQNQNVLPPQQVLQANGKASIDALQMSPNSSVIIIDNTAPIVWLCTSDGIGKVTAKAYDIKEHQEAPSVDMESVEERLATVEKFVSELKENIYAKLNARDAESKPIASSYRKSGEDKGRIEAEV